MKQQMNKCTILRAIDGDTFEVRLELGWDVSLTQHIQIKGITCYKLADKDPEKREIAFKARKEACALVGKSADIKASARDKYGRMLCEMNVDGYDYANYLLDRELAEIFED